MRSCHRHRTNAEQATPRARLARALVSLAVALVGLAILGGTPAAAQSDPPPPAVPPITDGGTLIDDAGSPLIPGPPVVEVPGPDTPDSIDDILVGVSDGSTEGATQPLTIIALLTVLGLAPTLLILMTSFTRIIIVLSITRNALSLQGVPPNQVLIGLALFLTIFVMAPVLSTVHEQALQPLLDGEISQGEAWDAGIEPFREFMLSQVREQDLAMFVELSDSEQPANPDDVATSTLIPAFVLSELRAAFIIGFLIFVPFLVIDIVVSATLMSMGMVMLPPVVISLPFKLLLFVVVDGWALLVPTLVGSFST